MRGVRAVAGLLGMFLIAGCGAADARPIASRTGTPDAATTPSQPTSPGGPRSTPSTRQTPARLTVAQARPRYLAVTRPYNVALERFETAANNGASVRTLRSRAGTVAAANLAESRLLLSTPWPTTVAGPVRELVRANAAARRHWLLAAAADDLTEMAGHIRRASATGGKEPAAEIRRRLGLPEYDESDYN
jgi:hypothetical protein